MEMTKTLKKLTAAAAAVCIATMELPLPTAVTRAAEPPEVPDFSFIGAVGTLTAEESAKAAEATYRAIAAHEPLVSYGAAGLDMTNDNVDSFIAIYNYVRCCFEVSIGTLNDSVGYNPVADAIEIDYRFEDSEYEAKCAEYKAMLDDIAAPVKASWSDEEKALYFHEYIASNFDYDYPAMLGEVTRPDGEEFSAYGMLKNGMAVCEGYANLYAMLMNKVGVPTKLTTSATLGHAWNSVKIGDNWYFVDATWDDLYYGYKGYVKHENFLATVSELSTTTSKHTSTDWLDSFRNDIYNVDVPTTFSGAFWRDTEKPIQRYQNKWLALMGDKVDVQFMLYDYNGATHTATSSPLTEKLDNSLAEWDVVDKPDYVWGDSYVIPVVINDILYFSTPKAVYSYHNGHYIELMHITSEQEATSRVYGLYCVGGKFYYSLDSKRRNTSEVMAVPVNSYELDIAALEAKVIAEAGVPLQKENSWTAPLKISDWKEGETPSVPTAAAKYGEPVFTYYRASDDTPLAGAPTAAGSYYVIARVPAAEDYEEIATEPVYFKVTSSAITIKVPDTTVIYQEPADFDIQVSGDISADEKAAVKSAVKVNCYDASLAETATPAGTYPITVNFDESAFAGKSFTYELGTLTVVKRTPFLDLEGDDPYIRYVYTGTSPESKMYKYLITNNIDSDVVLEYQWFSKNGDGTYTELSEAPVHCGEYKVIANQHESANFNAKTLEVPLFIVPAQLTAAFADEAVTYGDAFSGKVKVKYTGLCEADKVLFPAEVDAVTSYKNGGNAGEYELGGVLPATSDYTYTVNKAKLTVKKKPLKVTAANIELTYGEAPPTKVEVAYEGLTASDEAAFMDIFAYETDCVQYSPVGTYEINPKLPDFVNYDVAVTAGTLTVKPKPVSVFWGTQFSFAYDGTEKQLTPKISGVVGSDEVKATLEGYKATKAGSYTAKITALSDSNYTVSDEYASMAWTIEKADLSVYPENMTISYGEIPAEGVVRAEGLAAGDDLSVIIGVPKLVTSYEQYKPVGDYDLTFDAGLTAEKP